MYYKETTPQNLPDGLWDEHSCVRRQGGYDLDKENLPASLKWLLKGAPLAFVSATGKVKLVKTAKVVAAAAKSDTTLKIEDNGLFAVGEKIAGSTISAIEVADGVATLTVSALGAAVKIGDVVDDGNADAVIGLNYAAVKIEGEPSCTPTLQAYEIEETSLPYPVNAAIKTALTSRHAFKIQ